MRAHTSNVTYRKMWYPSPASIEKRYKAETPQLCLQNFSQF